MLKKNDNVLLDSLRIIFSDWKSIMGSHQVKIVETKRGQHNHFCKRLLEYGAMKQKKIHFKNK